MRLMSLQRIWALVALSMLELYRRKDVLVAFLLAAVIIVPLTFLNVFGVEGVVRYLREVTLLLIWLFSIVIGITVAARQFPAEIESRTLYPLLSKPVHRGEILVGKYLGALLASGSALVLFYACFVLLTGFKEGVWISATLVQALVFHLCFLAVLAALALTVSLLLTPSATIAVCVLVTGGMLLFGERLGQVAATGHGLSSLVPRVVHFVAPHFEFFDLRLRLVHGWEPLPAGVFLCVILYTIGYAAFLLALGNVLLRRRRL